METRITHAIQFATEAHGDQLYGGTRPYIAHCIEVMQTLESFGVMDEDTLVAAVLHDVLEDTPTDSMPLSVLFGDRVTRMVIFCTDEPGYNRKTRKALTYARCRRDIDSGAEVYRFAARVKLADRLANIQNCTGSSAGLLQMYRKERDAFRDALYIPGDVDAMWALYDRLLED